MTIYEFGSFEVDDEGYELRRDGVTVPMQRRAFDLLLHLVRNAGAVCTREQLRVHVWDGVIVTKDAVTHAALSVREAVDDETHGWIRTVRGRGYAFVGDVVARPGRPRIVYEAPISQHSAHPP